jgi:PAS domain S-box-containing protein
MIKEVSPQIRRLSQGTGISFVIIALICVIRICGFILMPDTGNLFLQSGKFDTLMVMLLMGATTFLVFNLVLMVNRRLYLDTEEIQIILNRNVMEFQALFKATSVGFGILVNRVFRDVNDATCEMLSYSREEIIGKETRMFYPTEEDYMAVGQIYQIIPQLGSATIEMRLLRKDGQVVNVIMGISAFDKNNLSQGVVLSLVNITKRKQSEEALRQSEGKYRLIVENTLDIIFTTNSREEYVYVSPSVKDILGYEPSELLGKPFTSIVHPDDLHIIREEIQSTYDERYKTSRESEYRLRHASGEWRWVVSRGTKVVDSSGRYLNFTGVIRDITEHKKAEENIIASLVEKEMLLKEVHHRVKNNMQVISSLLRLQEGRVKDKDSAVLLKDSQNRIQSMALVYNKLYQSNNLASIDMTEYIRELTVGLVKSYAVNPSRVTVNLVPGEVFLSVDLAIPCGMVVNELVTNSLKYAFPENRKGQISLSLKENDNREFELVVSDNGLGIPDGIDLENGNTLGLKLVNNLVQNQLGGKIELDRSHGTVYRIIFPRVREEK